MNKHWKTYLGLSAVGIALVTGLSIWTQIWVLTAIPIGFFFGFLLQKGDLSGASAFSDVLVMRDCLLILSFKRTQLPARRYSWRYAGRTSIDRP